MDIIYPQMSEAEWKTRKERIDRWLKSLPQPWEIVRGERKHNLLLSMGGKLLRSLNPRIAVQIHLAGCSIQKLDQFQPQFFCIFHLALPDREHRPAICVEPIQMFVITLNIAYELWLPVF